MGDLGSIPVAPGVKSGQGNRGLSACGTTHGASLKFPSEAGFILTCAGKAGDPSIFNGFGAGSNETGKTRLSGREKWTWPHLSG